MAIEENALSETMPDDVTLGNGVSNNASERHAQENEVAIPTLRMVHPTGIARFVSSPHIQYSYGRYTFDFNSKLNNTHSAPLMAILLVQENKSLEGNLSFPNYEEILQRFIRNSIKRNFGLEVDEGIQFKIDPRSLNTPNLPDYEIIASLDLTLGNKIYTLNLTKKDIVSSLITESYDRSNNFLGYLTTQKTMLSMQLTEMLRRGITEHNGSGIFFVHQELENVLKNIEGEATEDSVVVPAIINEISTLIYSHGQILVIVDKEGNEIELEWGSKNGQHFINYQEGFYNWQLPGNFSNHIYPIFSERLADRILGTSEKVTTALDDIHEIAVLALNDAIFESIEEILQPLFGTINYNKYDRRNSYEDNPILQGLVNRIRESLFLQATNTDSEVLLGMSTEPTEKTKLLQPNINSYRSVSLDYDEDGHIRHIILGTYDTEYMFEINEDGIFSISKREKLEENKMKYDDVELVEQMFSNVNFIQLEGDEKLLALCRILIENEQVQQSLYLDLLEKKNTLQVDSGLFNIEGDFLLRITDLEFKIIYIEERKRFMLEDKEGKLMSAPEELVSMIKANQQEGKEIPVYSLANNDWLRISTMVFINRLADLSRVHVQATRPEEDES